MDNFSLKAPITLEVNAPAMPLTLSAVLAHQWDVELTGLCWRVLTVLSSLPVEHGCQSPYGEVFKKRVCVRHRVRRARVMSDEWWVNCMVPWGDAVTVLFEGSGPDVIYDEKQLSRMQNEGDNWSRRDYWYYNSCQQDWFWHQWDDQRRKSAESRITR